ncbi:MAG TPA: hypothetical protein DHV48_09095 [Prolixibacteraceae bacterium]|nr:hypothetical protein [Prolixibacteraceae bacterium]
MNLATLMPNIHWIPVIVMTIVSFALGAAWHQKFLFGKTWTNENKPTLDRKMNIPLIFGGTAVVHFLTLAGLNGLVAGTGWHNGLHVGLFVSVIFILPALTATYLFANRSLRLLAIDTGMYVLLFAMAGAVFGVW